MTTSRRLKFGLPNFFSTSKTRKSEKFKYRRFSVGFFAAAFIPALAVGLVNVAVDPYDTFNTPNFWGINHVKPSQYKNDRLYKAIHVVGIKPKSIFIGSSRAKQALDPSHPALKDLQPAYNLGLNGPNFYELRRYLEHAIANQPDLKKVIVGLDFFMFNSAMINQPSFSEERLEKQYMTLQDLINTTLSWNVLAASKETIEASLKDSNNNSNYGDNGFSPYVVLKSEETQWRFNSGVKLYYSLHSNYEFSQAHFEEFKKFVALCKQREISLKIFISPTHASDLEAIRATGRWETFEQWKREVVKVVPVWDFSGYHSIATEPINERTKNYSDNSHYTPRIGNLILNRILSYQPEKVPKDFGIFLTPKNVESQIAKIRAEREVWARKNPEQVRWVQDLKREFDQNQKSKP